MPTARIIALVGPTAVGKTDVSLALAKRLSAGGGSAFGGDAQIVGCDSMQVYRRMPILTQQPTPEQRATVPHHLIDCIEPSESFNVGEYRRLAMAAIEAITRRGKQVLVVGGTGMYLRALTDGLCEAPPSSREVRNRLRTLATEQGNSRLHDQLQAVDPQAATKIHPRDTQRLVRALEVFELTGKPLSSFWTRGNGQALDVVLIGLTRDRAQLYDRINRRVERMIHHEGVLEEAKRALELPLSHTARQVHGLRYLEAYFKETVDLAEAITQWQQQVRQYARRQLIWFRAEPRIRWITIRPGESTEAIVDRIFKQLQSGQTPSHFATLSPGH